MRKVLFAFLLVFSCSAISITPEDVNKALNATVMVTSEGSGFGSGVVISPDGFIVTNYHVIHRSEPKIFFYNPEDLNYYDAEIVGIDPVADLALLKVNMPEEYLPLPYLNIDTEVELAEEVTAIGHPMGLQWSVTKGTINHLNRPGKITPYVNVIQHSALINKGNSGGPLVNADGEIVGINTYIMSPKGEWTGVAYAVRGDTVHESVKQMQDTGEVVYSAMKMGVRSLNQWYINQLIELHPEQKFPTNIYGLIATEIEKDDYAYNHGIRNFDVIIALNGIPINYLGDLKEIMNTLSPDDVVTLLIIRDGHIRTMPYTIGRINFDVYMEFYDDSPEPKKD
jgi:serine protease Do